MAIGVLAPDINESFRNFSVVPKENKIRFGLLAIKNAGENIVETIITERKNGGQFQSISDFVHRINSRNLNKKSLESLIKAGVFDKFEERNKLLLNLEGILETNREIQKNINNGQKNLFEGTSSFSPTIKLKEVQPASLPEKLKWEKELLGLYVSSHPLQDYKKVFEKKVLSIINIDDTLIGKRVKIGGIISSIKRIITKKGKPMLFLNLEDLTNKIEVIVFPDLIEENPTALQEDKIVFIEGRVDNRNGEKKIVAEGIEEVVNTI